MIKICYVRLNVRLFHIHVIKCSFIEWKVIFVIDEVLTGKKFNLVGAYHLYRRISFFFTQNDEFIVKN